MRIKLNGLKKSAWVFCFSGNSCGNCDAEALNLSSARFDAERLGIVFTDSARGADMLLVSGAVGRQAAARLKKLYEQTTKPCVVVAVGACALGEGIFKAGYSGLSATDKIIPVDVHIPGCPPRPQAIIRGILKALEKTKHA